MFSRCDECEDMKYYKENTDKKLGDLWDRYWKLEKLVNLLANKAGFEIVPCCDYRGCSAFKVVGKGGKL